MLDNILNLHYGERKRVNQELRAFRVPIQVIGNMPEKEQLELLSTLKTKKRKTEIDFIIEELRTKYEDK